MNDELLASLPVEPGTLVAGKYRVEKLLAVGGMGAVIKARHEVLNKDVAIKLMRPETTKSVEAGQRFLREARATATLESDYIARVTDVDLLDDGTPFMVMEYLEGRDLSGVLDVHERIEVSQAIDWTMQLLCGLAHAHAMGIVHRDLKPANLFLVKRSDGSRRIKILDFGISKVLDETRADSGGVKAGATTNAQALLGTPRYMSPEQVRSSKNVDGRTDLWAVGLILYELVTGTYPFEGETTGAVLANILTSPLPTAHGTRKEVPLEISAIIDRCLQRERDDRYQSAREVMEALGPFASKRMQALLLDAADSPLTVPPPPHPNTAKAADPLPTADTLLGDDASLRQPSLEAASIDQDALSTRAAAVQQTDMSWQGSREAGGDRRKLLLAAIVLLVGVGGAYVALRQPAAAEVQGPAADAPSAAPAATAIPASAVTTGSTAVAPLPSASAASDPNPSASSAGAAPPTAKAAAPAPVATAPTAASLPTATGRLPTGTTGKGVSTGAKGRNDDPLGLKRRR